MSIGGGMGTDTCICNVIDTTIVQVIDTTIVEVTSTVTVKDETNPGNYFWLNLHRGIIPGMDVKHVTGVNDSIGTAPV